ncbi:MAG: hypothetical protein ACO38I_08180 [Ilumatobacteraceae bacterium]
MIGPRRVIALALVSAALAGCAYLDADAEPLPPVANAPETLTATETSVAGGDVTDASEVSPDEPAVTTTTTTTTTLPPTTTIPPPLGVDELILGPNGIGGALLGADPDTSVGYISSILGAPTDDSGWVDPLEFYLCRGTTVRRVEWGVLSVMFGDESDIATGRTHLISWTYGLIDRLGDEPLGLRTAGGVTLGDQLAGLRAEFGSIAVDEGDADLDIPPSFYIGPTLRGLSTGVADEDYVLVLIGGSGCTG